MTERQPLTARDKLLRSIPEATVQKEVQQILTMSGFWWFHAPSNRPGQNGKVERIVAGFPDIIAVRGTRIVVAELKKETGHTTDEQDKVLAMFELTGKVEVWVVRPSNIDEFRDAMVPRWAR